MFHRIWLNPEGRHSGPPPAYEANWAAWQRQFPGVPFKTWTGGDIEAFENVSAQVNEAKGMARKADIFRYAILEKMGGIYLDCDIEPYHRPVNLDAITDILVCNEDDDTNYCSIGFIAAPPRAPLFGDIISEIRGSVLNARDPNLETGPHLFGRHLKKNAGVRRLPTAAYYPYRVHEPRSAILDRDLGTTVGIHLWGASWASDGQRQANLGAKVARGDAAEIEEAVRNGVIGADSPLVTLSRELRRMRDGYAQVAMTFADKIAPFDLGAKACFEFLKILYWLQERSFDITVWQIGAADGVLVDPLRPFMVRHDPKAVLIEPNPHIFEHLKRNYANNTRTQFVAGALAREDGSFAMTCVVPEEVRNHGLPEWVMGLSSVHSDKNALDGRDLPPALHAAILKTVRQETVTARSVQSVLAQTGAALPNVLVVDAEGMDAQIILTLLENRAEPFLIHFEHCNLGAAERGALDAALHDNYVLFLFGNDATAVRKDVLLTYASHIWVEHGIQSLFAPIFDVVNPFRSR